MKILILADNMDNGGAETHVYELSRNLSLLGHNVTVLSNGGRVANRLSAIGIRQMTYGALPLSALASLIRTEKPDIIHAHTRKSAFLCRLLQLRFRFPFVFTAHAIFSDKQPKKALSCFSFPAYTIAVGEDIAKHLSVHFHLPSKQITVIPNGIDTAKYCPKKGTIPRSHTILTVSRMDKDCSMAARLLCKIAPILFQEYHNTRIVIVGGGNDFPEIMRLASKANSVIGHRIVDVVGTQSDILPYLRSADVFVGVSRAALEAMACRIPVILCGNEGYLGIADKKILPIAEKSNFCARGAKTATPESLLRDIRRVFRDADYTDLVASDGYEQIQCCHTAEYMAQKTLEVYRNAIRDFKRERQSDILLCGYYGYGNLGDELTLHSIRLQLEKQGVTRFAVLARPGKRYDGILCVNRFDPISVIRSIRHTGLLLFGGGSLLQNKTSNRSLLYYLSLLRLSSFFGIPSMLYACGIGPIKGTFLNLLVKQTLAKTDIITVRDPDSLHYLQEMKLNVPLALSADPVIFCRMPKRVKSGYTVVFVRQNELGRFIRFLSEQKSDVCIAVMDRNADTRASRILAARLRQAGIRVKLEEGLSPGQTASLIAGASLVVSARLHALILSFCAGVPFVGLSDDPKILSFCQCTKNSSYSASIETHIEGCQQIRNNMKVLAKRDPQFAQQLSKCESPKIKSSRQ